MVDDVDGAVDDDDDDEEEDVAEERSAVAIELGVNELSMF